MEKKNLMIGLISLLLLPTIALATSVQTKINVTNGSATVKQTVGNQTIEIETNESANIFTEIKDSIVSFFIQATGTGNVKTNLTGDYNLTATADEKTETQYGTGIFSAVYQFFRSFIFSAWVKISQIKGVAT